jgi:TRAP-type C4-dicarboxylate transport system permease small subunit
MNRVLSAVESTLGSLTRIMSSMGSIFILLMTLLTTADVVCRYIFNNPIHGAHELTEFMMIFTVFLGLAGAQYVKINISVGIIVDRLPKKIQNVISSFYYIFCIGITSIITWQSIIQVKLLWDTGRYTDVLKIPLYISEIMLAFGCFMLLVVFLLDFVNSLAERVRQ